MAKRVLLDENLSHKLRGLLAGHTVITTLYQGWAGKLNGELVALAEQAAFDVMVTADQNLSTNREKLVLANVARILAVDAASAGSYELVDIGH